MEFLGVNGDYRELGEAWTRYRAHLEAIKGDIPSDAYEFAVAPWHYDPADHRSLHDAWVESVCVQEEAARSGEAERRLSIVVRLLGAYHDGHTYLSYSDVKAYQFTKRGSDSHQPLTSGHGDWLVDEVRRTANGNLIHEVVFSSGAHWLIECGSIKHSTDIPAVRS